MRIQVKVILLVVLLALLPVACFALAFSRLQENLNQLNDSDFPLRIEFNELSFEYFQGEVELEFFQGDKSLGSGQLRLHSGPLYRSEKGLSLGLGNFDLDLHQQPGSPGGLVNEYSVVRIEGEVPFFSAPQYHATVSELITPDQLQLSGVDLKWSMAQSNSWKMYLEIQELESLASSERWFLKKIKGEKEAEKELTWSATEAQWLGSLLEVRLFKLQGELGLTSSEVSSVFQPFERLFVQFEEANGNLGSRALVGRNISLQLERQDLQILSLKVPQLQETLGEPVSLELQLSSPRLLNGFEALREFVLVHQQPQQSIFDFSFEALEEVDLKGMFKLRTTSTPDSGSTQSESGWVVKGFYRDEEFKLILKVPLASCSRLSAEVVGLFSWPQREAMIAKTLVALQREGLVEKKEESCVVEVQRSPEGTLNWNEIAQPKLALKRFEASLAPPPKYAVHYEGLAAQGALSQFQVQSALVQQQPGLKCVERHWPALCLEESSTLQETFHASWEIAPEGKPEVVRLHSGNRTPQALLNCMISDFRSLQFEKGTATTRAEVNVSLKPARFFRSSFAAP